MTARDRAFLLPEGGARCSTVGDNPLRPEADEALFATLAPRSQTRNAVTGPAPINTRFVAPRSQRSEITGRVS